MNFLEFNIYAVLLFFSCPRRILSDKRRPYYNIGHMVNSIEQIEGFLQKGSNAIEFDVQFSPDGSVNGTLHGSPCDCGRYCEGKADLKKYLKHLRNITDPRTPGNYYEQLVMVFFDLKLITSNDKMKSGRDIARHVIKYLWSENGDREQEIRALIYFEDINDKDVVLGFKREFERLGQSPRLKDVGFDGGSGNISVIKQTFADLKIENVWIGDGNTNCIIVFWPDRRLKEAIAVRDSSDGFIDDVYKWTVDQKGVMRSALRFGVDGMITNKPERLLEVLEESEFEESFRLATVKDNPFEKYTGK